MFWHEKQAEDFHCNKKNVKGIETKEEWDKTYDRVKTCEPKNGGENEKRNGRRKRACRREKTR